MPTPPKFCQRSYACRYPECDCWPHNPPRPETVLARFIRCRQEAIDSADYDRQERLDGASSDLLDEDDFTAYTRAARAQDDALRARVIAMPAPMIPFYCKECRAFTGNERHDHAQKGAQD